MKRKCFLFTTFVIAILLLFESCIFLDFSLERNKPKPVPKKKYYTQDEAKRQLRRAYGGSYTFAHEIKCDDKIKKHYVFTSSGGALPDNSEVHYACFYNSALEDIEGAEPIDTFSNGMALRYSSFETEYYNNLISGKGPINAAFSDSRIIFNNSDRIFEKWDFAEWETESGRIWIPEKMNSPDFIPPDYLRYGSYSFMEHTDAFIFIKQTGGIPSSEEEFKKNIKSFLGCIMDFGVSMFFEIFILPETADLNELKVSDATDDAFRKSCIAIYKSGGSDDYAIKTVKPFVVSAEGGENESDSN